MYDQLKTLLHGDIDLSSDTLDRYSRDASIFCVRPEVVVYPKDAEDIKHLVKWVRDNKSKYPHLSITVRAAGTCMSGGSLNDSIIIDTTRYMNALGRVRRVAPYQIVPLFPKSHPVTVTGEAVCMPGLFYRDFESIVSREGLMLPCYTASKSINAIGGMVGNNSAGELTLRYGKTEDYVSELKIVLQDGYEYTVRPLTRRELYTKIAQTDFEGTLYKTIYDMMGEHRMLVDAAKPRVSKNSAGYNIWNVMRTDPQTGEEIFDLSQLIIGSQGTLGIVTEVTLRLVEIPKTSKLLVVFLHDLTHLGQLVDEILPFQPISIESYDDKTFKLALKFFKDFVKAKGIFGMIRFGLSFIPEFWMLITGGVPKLILLVECAGDTENETTASCQKIQNAITHFGFKTRITKNEAEARKYWDMRRDSFALLRKHVAGLHTAPFIDDIIVPPETLPEFLPKLNALLEVYPNITYTIAGHAGNGNFHIIPLMDFNDPKTKEIILTLSDKVYDLVIRYNGSITAEHNDGIIRTPYLSKMFSPEIISLFSQIKDTFDPQILFNPGKKVGGTREAIVEYMEKPVSKIKD